MLIIATLLAFAYNSVSPVGIRLGNSARDGDPKGIDKLETSNLAATLVPGTRPSLRGNSTLAGTTAMRDATSAPTAIAPAQSSGVALISTPVASAALATNPAPVTWAVLKPRLAAGQVLLLDARAKPHFEAGHIPGAILLSVFSSTDEFVAFQRTYPSNTPLAVYCGSASCPLSLHLAERLVSEFGYQHVEHMTTGYLEWQDSEKGKPEVTVSPAAPPPIAADTSGPLPLPVLWDAARARVAGGEVTLVDIRSASDFAAGHLARAVSLPAESNPSAIAEFRKNHPPSRPILVYGTWTGSVETFNHARRLMKEHGFGRAEYLHEGFIELRLKNITKSP